jgi:hypothetical protein
VNFNNETRYNRDMAKTREQIKQAILHEGPFKRKEKK